MAAAGKLGAVDLTAGVPESLYYNNTDNIATVNIDIVNRRNDKTFVSIAVSAESTSPLPEDYIDFGVELLPKGVLHRTAIILSPQDYIYAVSSQDRVNAVVYGFARGNEV